MLGNKWIFCVALLGMVSVLIGGGVTGADPRRTGEPPAIPATPAGRQFAVVRVSVLRQQPRKRTWARIEMVNGLRYFHAEHHDPKIFPVRRAVGVLVDPDNLPIEIGHELWAKIDILFDLFPFCPEKPGPLGNDMTC